MLTFKGKFAAQEAQFSRPRPSHRRHESHWHIKITDLPPLQGGGFLTYLSTDLLPLRGKGAPSTVQKKVILPTQAQPMPHIATFITFAYSLSIILINSIIFISGSDNLCRRTSAIAHIGTFIFTFITFSLTFASLIQKDRGNRPVDVLATFHLVSIFESGKVPNPILPLIRWREKISVCFSTRLLYK